MYVAVLSLAFELPVELVVIEMLVAEVFVALVADSVEGTGLVLVDDEEVVVLVGVLVVVVDVNPFCVQSTYTCLKYSCVLMAVFVMWHPNSLRNLSRTSKCDGSCTRLRCSVGSTFKS